MAAKLTAAIVPVLAGVVAWMFTTFETTSASDQKWEMHNQAIACRTVYEWKAEIRAKTEQLRHDKSLSEADRKWLEQEIKNLQEDIKRIDPKGVC